jgi:hypothetical protein
MKPRAPRSQRKEQADKAAMAGVAVTGTKAVRQVTIKIFHVGGKTFSTHRHRAPNGKCFLQSAIERLIADTADKLETFFPDEEYSLVSIGTGCFNFVWKGKKTEVASE